MGLLVCVLVWFASLFIQFSASSSSVCVSVFVLFQSPGWLFAYGLQCSHALVRFGKAANCQAKCLVLDRESFNLLLGPLKDIIDATREGRQRPERAAPEAQGCRLAQAMLIMVRQD